MLYVVNSFSLNMLPFQMETFVIKGRKVTIEEAADILKRSGFQSYVGHEDLAGIVTSQLGVSVLYNRQTLTVQKGDSVLVCQYRGPRLPEGATTLPEGAVIEYYLVEIE